MPARHEATQASREAVSDSMHARLLEQAFADGSPTEIAHTLGIIARARGMTEVARRTGLAREALYRALSRDGDPKLSTLLRVVRALDIRLDAELGDSGSPIEREENRPAR